MVLRFVSLYLYFSTISCGHCLITVRARRDGCCWLIHKSRALSQMLSCWPSYYLISLTILYFGFQYHLQLLENQHLFLPEKYQSFTTMLSMQLAFPFLYPTSVTSILFLISFYVSVVTGGTSVIYACRSEISCMSGWLYPSYLLLMYLSYTSWKSYLLMLFISLLYSAIFIIQLKKCCDYKQPGGYKC